MSVYTTVSQDELALFLQSYDQGELIDYQGISAGIENTNYFVNTGRGHFVLTLFEALTAAELPYFLDLMAYLAEHQVPSAHPLPDRNGHYLTSLNQKPAALVQKLDGKMVETPNVAQVAALGQAIGRMHAVSPDFSIHRDNERGPHWWRETAKALDTKLDTDSKQLLHDELEFQSRYRHADLPRGVIHADLFRDNALFVGEKLTGIIDFYYACNDVLLYDLAVIVNDWCTLADGSLDEDRVRSLLQAYHTQRPLTALERGAWPVMLRAAALRFWLSRLYDLHFPREGEMTHTKDPDAFKRILMQRVAQHDAMHGLWV